MTRSIQTETYLRLRSAIKQARRDAGLTQQQLADVLDRPQSYIAKVEGGERRLDVVELIELCDGLAVDPAVLFGQILLSDSSLTG